jgi:hypothetical protein
MMWTDCAADMGKKRYTSTFMVRRPQGQTTIERLQSRRENNFKVNFTVVEWDSKVEFM